MRLAIQYEFDTLEAVSDIYTSHAGQRQWVSENRIKARNALLSKYDKGIPVRRRFRAQLRFLLGVEHLKDGRSGEARKQLASSLFLFPKLRTFAYLLLTLDGGRTYVIFSRVKHRSL